VVIIGVPPMCWARFGEVKAYVEVDRVRDPLIMNPEGSRVPVSAARSAPAGTPKTAERTTSDAPTTTETTRPPVQAEPCFGGAAGTSGGGFAADGGGGGGTKVVPPAWLS